MSNDKWKMEMIPPVILGIDTASRGGSVCLARGNSILASRIGDPGISHSNSLLMDINVCLEEAGVSLREVDLFAAASGPGSFTGLRIGLATVKALARTLARPCAGIPTLYAVAHAAGPSSATIAVLPAGRGEVFAQMLSVSSDGTVTGLDTPAHLAPQRLLDKYGSLRNLKWSGEGAQVHRDLVAEYAREKGIEFSEYGLAITREHEGWILAPKQESLSKNVAALALREFERGEVIEPHSLSAIYVRPSDAELKWP